MSKRTTSASPASAMRCAVVAPTLPAPMTVTLLRAMKPRSPFRSSERPILTSVDDRSGHPWMVGAVEDLDSRTRQHPLLESHDGPDPGARSPRTAPRPARDPAG